LTIPGVLYYNITIEILERKMNVYQFNVKQGRKQFAVYLEAESVEDAIVQVAELERGEKINIIAYHEYENGNIHDFLNLSVI
jgi:cell division protein FtsL